jgi:hypothetical protein
MLFKLLSSVLYYYKKLVTPQDYRIISEELEYTIDYRKKYDIEDDFWREESVDWDGVMHEFYVLATGKNFRHTIIPQNVDNVILRIKYWYNGKIYKVITSDINFVPSEPKSNDVRFSIPLSRVWLLDQDDKPVRDITEKVRRYAGPRNDFHGQDVKLVDFLYYTRKTLKDEYPKLLLLNTLGMKKLVLTLEDSTTDLRIP